MKKIIISGILIVFSFHMLVLSADVDFETVAKLSWGREENVLGTRLVCSGRYGPSDFSVKDKNLYLLDRENNRIAIFSITTKKLSTLYKIAPYAERFAVGSDGTYAYYCSDGFRVVKNDASFFFRRPSSFRVVDKMIFSNRYLYASNEKGVYYKIFNVEKFKKVNSNEGICAIFQDERFVNAYLKKENINTLRIVFNNREGIDFNYSRGSLGASQLLYVGDKYIILITEEVYSSNPISAKKKLLAIDHNGKLLASINIPQIYYTYLPRAYGIYNGKLYYCLSKPDGLQILSLSISDILTIDGCALTSKFQEEYHYNDYLLNANYECLIDSDIAKAEDTISRSRVIENAEPFEELIWTASSSNISNGIVQTGDGSSIRTPDWVTVGEKQKVPYKWGGWTSIDTFTAGVTAGKYTGDNYTSSVSWSDTYCIGLDCSGYVSRAWDTKQKYGTATLPGISTPLDNFSDMKRGDILNKPDSHVRLCVEDNPSGSVLTLESAGADWRVSYRSFDFSSLSGYTPRYFNEIIDDSTSVADVADESKFCSNLISVKNYPNPFSKTTIIQYSVKRQGNITVNVYNMFGKKIRTLCNQFQDAGKYTVSWNRTNEHNLSVSNGVYYLVVSVNTDGSEKFTQRKKMILQ